MSEPTIRCPNCRTEIKLTESLAAPLIDATRRHFELRLAEKDAEVARREAAIQEQQASLKKSRDSLEQQIAARLEEARADLVAAEAKKARDALADEIALSLQEKAAIQALLKDRDAKLAEARRNEMALRLERQQLADEKERFELDKQRTIDAERAKIREATRKETEEQAHMRLAEKDKTISDLQNKLQEALRKSEQGSQQLQGEIQELQLEARLRDAFPRDTIEPVAKGEFGGDTLQRVVSPLGQPCGAILWESKRTKNWSDGWLPKLRDDMRAAGAEAAIIVTQVLPKSIETFDLVEGVWVTSFKCAMPVAVALRQLLIELSAVRRAAQGQQTKMELVYLYLTGPRFRHRVQAIVEKFSDMQEDLEKERKVMARQWAKREEQIRGVIETTAGMYGDLQGIAGSSLPEIEGLSLKLLGDGEGNEWPLPRGGL